MRPNLARKVRAQSGPRDAALAGPEDLAPTGSAGRPRTRQDRSRRSPSRRHHEERRRRSSSPDPFSPAHPALDLDKTT
eukprot:7095539-Pyramimonas_sp.AAC.1